MNPFKFISNLIPSNETKSIDIVSAYDLALRGGSGSGADVVAMHQLQTRLAWAYYMSNQPLRHAAEMIWGVQFASVTYQVFDNQNNEFIPKSQKTPLDHLVNMLDRKPNKDMSGSTFKKMCNISHNVTGDMYIQVTAINESAEPISIDYVAPQYVVPIVDGNDQVTAYSVTGGKYMSTYEKVKAKDGSIIYVDEFKHELIHIKNFQPDPSQPTGLAMISSAIRELDQIHAAMVQNTSFIKKGSRPAGVITMPEGVMPQVEDKLAIIDRFKQFYAGGDNAGNVIFLEGGKDFKELSVNNKDMDYVLMMDANTRKIYLSMNVPMPLVDTKTMTHSNYAEAKYTFYDMSIIPACEFFASEINRALARRYKTNKDRYSIRVNRREVPAIKDRLDIQSMESGVLSTNERREILGKESVGEDGDIIYINNAQMPLGSDPMQVGMGNGGDNGDGGISKTGGKITDDKPKDKPKDEDAKKAFKELILESGYYGSQTDKEIDQLVDEYYT